MGRRVAIMRVSGELLRSLLPPGKVIDLQADKIQRAKDFEWLRLALLLPDNCRVDDVSPHCYFATDQYALRLECDDFVETKTGLVMPAVRAEYVTGPDGKGRFSHWVGGVRNEYVVARKIDADNLWLLNLKTGERKRPVRGSQAADGPPVLGKAYETFYAGDAIDESRRIRFREWL